MCTQGGARGLADPGLWGLTASRYWREEILETRNYEQIHAFKIKYVNIVSNFLCMENPMVEIEKRRRHERKYYESTSFLAHCWRRAGLSGAARAGT